MLKSSESNIPLTSHTKEILTPAVFDKDRKLIEFLYLGCQAVVALFPLYFKLNLPKLYQ